MPVGRSDGPAYGLAAVGWLWVCRANAAQPGACWRVAPLPVPGGGARSLAEAGRFLSGGGQFPVGPGPTDVWERIRCSSAADLQRGGHLVSSNPTVTEPASFVQQNPSGSRFQRSLRLVNKYGWMR